MKDPTDKINLAIAFSPDSVYMSPFIARLLELYGNGIKLVICTSGSITKRKSIKQRASYFFALVIILGPLKAAANVCRLIFFSTKWKNCIEKLCNDQGIKYIQVKTINSEDAIRNALISMALGSN